MRQKCLSCCLTVLTHLYLGVNVLLLPMGRGDDGAQYVQLQHNKSPASTDRGSLHCSSTNEKLDRSNYINGVSCYSIVLSLVRSADAHDSRRSYWVPIYTRLPPSKLDLSSDDAGNVPLSCCTVPLQFRNVQGMLTNQVHRDPSIRCMLSKTARVLYT